MNKVGFIKEVATFSMCIFYACTGGLGAKQPTSSFL